MGAGRNFVARYRQVGKVGGASVYSNALHTQVTLSLVSLRNSDLTCILTSSMGCWCCPQTGLTYRFVTLPLGLATLFHSRNFHTGYETTGITTSRTRHTCLTCPSQRDPPKEVHLQSLYRLVKIPHASKSSLSGTLC